ncbi:MAG: hypothetical protein BGN83_04945 [Rhizobium sp. 63-7]|nr:MAG: hypothetical protein BGN83_04945 [Rhizobium sp. 63-7]
MVVDAQISLTGCGRPLPFWALPGALAADIAGGPAKPPAFAFDARRNACALTGLAPASIAAATAAAIGDAVRPVAFADLFLFSRAGTATYLASDGTIRTAAADTARFDWSNGSRQLLVEAQVANLLLQSRNLAASPWTAVDMAAVRGQPSLFGDGDAFRLTGASTDARYSQSVSVTSGQTYCFWAWMKPGTAAQSRLRAYDGANAAGYEITVSWASRTAASTGSGSATPFVTAFPGGYYRVGFSFAPAGTALQLQLFSGAGTVDFDGAQLESGLSPSSYVPTTTASVTRSGDVCRFSPAGEAVLQRAAAGVVIRGQGMRGAFGAIVGGTAMSRLVGFNSTQNSIVFGASSIVTLASAAAPLPPFGVAAAWNGSGKAGCYNGATVQNTAVALDTTLTKSYLGRAESGNVSSGHYDFIALYPFRMADAALPAKAVAHL